MHRGMLPQLWVSLQPSQAPSSQIYPPCGIPENPHGMLSPGVLQEGAHQGHGAALTAAARDGAALPVLSTLTLCLQVIYPLFTENRLIHSVTTSLATDLSSACQVPPGYPLAWLQAHPAPLQRRKSVLSFYLQILVLFSFSLLKQGIRGG